MFLARCSWIKKLHNPKLITPEDLFVKLCFDIMMLASVVLHLYC